MRLSFGGFTGGRQMTRLPFGSLTGLVGEDMLQSRRDRGGIPAARDAIRTSRLPMAKDARLDAMAPRYSVAA
jgi:hypothetical protein